MEYIIKDLVFKKKEDVSCNCYIAKIKNLQYTGY